jgi:hypothetical protein
MWETHSEHLKCYVNPLTATPFGRRFDLAEVLSVIGAVSPDTPIGGSVGVNGDRRCALAMARSMRVGPAGSLGRQARAFEVPRTRRDRESMDTSEDSRTIRCG